MGPKQGKVWGTTQCVFSKNDIESHLIEVVEGGFCSRHYHRSKWNRFLILSGCLIVRIFRNDQVDESVLTAGNITDVPPGVLHEFEALEQTTAIEFYWVELDPNDIVREFPGGRRHAS